jgi:hypothetical protein
MRSNGQAIYEAKRYRCRHALMLVHSFSLTHRWFEDFFAFSCALGVTAPFSKRLHGHNQITDAYLLGMAINEGLVLATFDQAMLHLAGEHSRHVLVLEAK